MHLYRKNRKIYDRRNKADKTTLGSACPFPFCDQNNTQEVLTQNKTMYVIANRVSYDIFEGCPVLDHLMVIPKRHVETLNDFTDQEKIDHMTIAGNYERQGYGVYARGVESVTRSVKHQHTHLIKLSGSLPKGILYLKKPYFLMHI